MTEPKSPSAQSALAIANAAAEETKAEVARSVRFTFKGFDRWGVAHTGIQSVPVAAFVESKYENRWQSLTVLAGGIEVGGIQRDDGGRLTWWAESPDPSASPTQARP